MALKLASPFGLMGLLQAAKCENTDMLIILTMMHMTLAGEFL